MLPLFIDFRGRKLGCANSFKNIETREKIGAEIPK